MKIHWRRLTAALLLLLALLSVAAAEDEAKDIAADCKLTASANSKYRSRLLNTDFQRYWPCAPGDILTVETPAGKPAQGIVVSFLGGVPSLTIESKGQVIGEYTETFIMNYIPFSEPAETFTITIGDGAEDIRFNRLQVISEGAVPAWVPRWERLEEPAEIMLVATHPDDELLWFGGMLPTYAGEYQKKVLVVYMVGNSTYRRCELLAGLWTCGVRYYPEISAFPDRSASSYESVLKLWGEQGAQEYVAEMIRKHQPAVVVTQDIHGEYGHAHHRVTVQAVIDAVTALAADPAWDEPSAKLYGVWQPRKLYLHLWPEEQITFDWQQPLAAFGGETSLSVTRRAFKLHASQQTGKYKVSDSGRLDSRLFGLYWSSIGPDELHNDLLEHIE